MSAGEIHLVRLRSYLEAEYAWLRKLITNNEPNLDDTGIRTRLLLGFALEQVANCPKEEIYAHITDGPNDRGIDAFYYDRINRKAYLFQSKYVDRPTAISITEADAKSLVSGVNELFSSSIFENGNKKITHLRAEIIEAISTTGVELFPYLISTSDKDIPSGAATILRDSFKLSMGDEDALHHLRLSDLYQIISPFGGGGGAQLQVELNGYQVLAVPFNGYYGWVTGTTLAELYQDQGVKLFSQNLRSGLGGTEINDDIFNTALKTPEKFWYFNNGVTFTSDRVTRSLQGGAAAENVQLSIANGSIVNGAQTTSTLAKLMNVEGGQEALARLKCLVRILEIPSDDRDFATDVTRFNNSQNGIGVKDFVSLDPFQQELRRGLDREFAINYIIRSGEEATNEQLPSITLQDATLALVSCGHSVDDAVRAKDKISVLWRDTSSTPYTRIFDTKRVTPLALYKAVHANRLVESFLRERIQSRGSESDDNQDRERAVATHGNRLFAYYVLSKMNIWRSEQGLNDFQEKLENWNLDSYFIDFVKMVFDKYGVSYKAPLFKNRSKCASIIQALPPVEPPIS